MYWHNPSALYLILPVCIGWLVLAIYSERRRNRAQLAFADPSMWTKIFPPASRGRFWCKQLCMAGAMVAGLVALARPQFGTEVEQVVPRGSDLYVLIDVSRSMLADDVAPSRLGRAKADVAALVNRLEGERIGLIAFAGQAVVKCPLTIDYDSFRRALSELDPNSAPRGGTAIGDAIRKALEVFQANVQRDQAILLITDGDDQQSYPLEAAALAAERKVTIFTVGLGDTQQGARVPQKADSKEYMEYQGEQVWSKLDGSLLSEIAIKTSGVYIPAGTKSYDLGELYSDHLQGRLAADGKTQQRVRRSEQYQWFLALSLGLLMIELWISPYRRVMLACILLMTSAVPAFAEEPHSQVREGLRLFQEQKFNEARQKFSSAAEELEKRKSNQSATAAFDEACAYHRNGEVEKARESYLKAGVSSDRKLAVAAHFNLGTLSAEQARTAAGVQPEQVPTEKRQEILDQLMQAAAAYRHCLELQPDHPQARKNLELVRQWIKVTKDKWHQQDLQKRRDESNLLVFLEYLMQTQSSLRQSVMSLPDTSTADVLAELNRLEKELIDEIPYLKEKIEAELKPAQDPQPAPANAPSSTVQAPQNSVELDEGLKLLQSWADAAGSKMSAASGFLATKQPTQAAEQQQAAIDELDKIWDAIVPFHPLLAKELADQTSLVASLGVKPSQANQPSADPAVEAQAVESSPTNPFDLTPPETLAETPSTIAQSLEASTALSDEQWQQLADLQHKTLRKSRLLAPKAEMELRQLESAPVPPASKAASGLKSADEDDSNADQQPTAEQGQIDPEEVKQGLRKAVELAPQAVEHMELASQSIMQRDHPAAGQHAEQARRLLEAIQKSQPKQPPQPNQNQDQEQQSDKSQNQEQPQEKSENQESPNNENKDAKGQDKQPKDDQQKGEAKSQPPSELSADRIEEALRKVRERQQEKRDRDRQIRARAIGRAPVDKDW